MSDKEELRRYMNILTESAETKVNPDVAEKLLTKMSPTYRKAKREDLVDEGISGMIGATVAIIVISVGGVEITQVGPFDVAGAQEMSRTIERDITRSYEKFHPHGWTDGSGNIYMLDDWTFDIETMHSSEYLDQQRQQNQ